jgi:hypothetical protein
VAFVKADAGGGVTNCAIAVETATEKKRRLQRAIACFESSIERWQCRSNRKREENTES